MTFVYTDEFEAKSSAVEEVFYDKETSRLLVVLTSGQGYVYKDVPASVLSDFRNAFSKGRFYAKNIKKTYGPGESLGYDPDVEERSYAAADFGSTYASGGVVTPTQASATLGTSKNLTYAKGAQVFDLTSKPVETKTERSHAVKFTVGDASEVKTYTTKAASVNEAVEALVEVGKMVDLTFNVKEVTVSFE